MADSPLVSISRAGYCERIETFTPGQLLRLGLDGQGLAPTAAETLLGITAGDIAAQALELATKGYVSFVARVSQTTNDTSDINLTDRGMTSPLASVRRLDLVAYAADGAAPTLIVKPALVQGDTTTPVAFLMPASVQVTNGLATVDLDPYKSLLTASTQNAETFAIVVSSNKVLARYTGQSGDATLAQIEVRVYPKVPLALV